MIIDAEYLQAIKDVENGKNRKKSTTQKSPRVNATLRKRKRIHLEKYETDEISGMEEESETESETEFEGEEEVEDNEDSEESLLRLSKNLSSPTSEEDEVQKWHACVYRIKGKPRLYIGKALENFLLD